MSNEKEREKRKWLVWATYVALGLLAPEIRAQDTLIVKLSLNRQDFSYGTQDGYDVIVPKLDRMSHISIPGHPQIPTWFPRYIIPWWKDIASCEILALDSVQIPGTWHIYPAQKEVPIGDSAEWTPPDPAIYNSDSLYPGKLQELPGSGVFDGARITTLNLYPIQYRPKSGRLFFYTSATLKLVFKDADPPINAKQRYAHVQEIYDRILLDLVENDADIGAWYRRPAIIDPNGEKNLLVPAYIIITTQAQSQDASLLAYKDWMFQRGYVTTIYCIEDILSGYSGYDDAERLRNFIVEKYSQWGTSFFLFLGEERKPSPRPKGIPYRKLCTENIGQDEDYIVPSDLYFSNLTGTWDLDGDHRYGEPEDYYGQGGPSYDFLPEVFVGRIVALTRANPPLNELPNWFNKVMNYEQNPENAGGSTHVFYSCGKEGGTMVWWDFGDSASIAQPHYPSHFTYTIYEDIRAQEHITYMNNNPVGWVNVMAHGRDWDVRAWRTGGSIPSDTCLFSVPGFPSHLGQLTNTNKYFIAYVISCQQGAYDDVYLYSSDTTTMEGFLESYGIPYRGAAACVAATRITFGRAFRIHRCFLDFLFGPLVPPGNRWLLGPADAWSKTAYIPWYPAPESSRANMAIRQSVFATNLFGSPLTEVWTNAPILTTTSASPNSIPVNQARSVTVTVRYFNGENYAPLPDARVTLYGCDIYRIGYTNFQGQVSFTVTPTQTGTIKATATKHDYKFSQTNIYVGLKGEVASDVNLPMEFFVSPGSSNPVKGDLNLQYGIPVEDEGLVSLKIYDVSGRAVQTVFSEEKAAGYYDLSVPTSSFSSGTYFLRLEAGARTLTEKVVIK